MEGLPVRASHIRHLHARLGLFHVDLFGHADGLKRRRAVQRAAEIADHGLVNLLMDLFPRLAQQALDRAVEQRLVAVVDAHACGRVSAKRDAVGRVHAFDPHVDGHDREVQALDSMPEGDGIGGAGPFRGIAVLLASRPALAS